MKSFIDIKADSDFSIYNIPFGVFTDGKYTGICTRIGDFILDLNQCQSVGLFENMALPQHVFNQRYLNDFIGLGKKTTSEVRLVIQDALLVGGKLDISTDTKNHLFLPYEAVTMLLPIQIGDYTDFYSSKEHATNVGIMFRDPANALLPNWLHLPVGYHGRSSSIVVSGTALHRPKGQTMVDGAASPDFGLSKQVDFELEMAFVIGKNSKLGSSIPIAEAEDYIFGLTLFNDWSARDIQKWEYVPLGPFLGKNFGSTLSPWIVTLEALEAFRVAGPEQMPKVLPYLHSEGLKNYNIELSVELVASNGCSQIISQSNFKYMYWNMCQQLAHHTVNGCNVQIGDLMASGTISGPTPDSFGSMLEICWKGTKPVVMSDGSERKFVQDGDTIKMRACCKNGDIRLGFGECDGMIIA